MKIKFVRTKLVSLILLALMLLVTGIAYFYIQKIIQQQGRVKFENQSQAIFNAINIRLDRDTYLLYSLRGLFAASKSVERSEFKSFGDGSQLSENFPGIYAIEFIEKVSDADKDSFIEGVRNDISLKSEGYPEFKIYPEEKRENYLALKYFYPEENSGTSIGFDFSSDANRNAAMEESLRNDHPVITERVKIIGTDEDAFIIFLPIYRNGLPTSTEAERRENLNGFVGVVIEVEKFFDSIIQSEKTDWENFDMYIYDRAPGFDFNHEEYLYDVDKEEVEDSKSEWAYFHDLPLEIAGKTWTLHFVAEPEYGTNKTEFFMMVTLISFGIIFSFVVAGAFYFMGTSRGRALNLAQEITKELKQNEEKSIQLADRLALATRAGGVGIWDYDVINNKLVWDDQMYNLYGTTTEKFAGAYEAWQTGLHPDDKKRGDDEIQMALRGEKDFDTEFRVLWPNGNIRYIRALANVQRDKSGKALRMVGTNWDITELKQSEEKIKEKIKELERLNKNMIGRELKMIELKKEINQFREQKGGEK